MLTSVVKAQLGRLGVDVKRMSPLSNFALQVAAIIARIEVDIVLDVGANIGQFAAELRVDGYRGAIMSFEPLTEAHRRLSNAAHSDALWTVYPRAALGRSRGEAVINVAGNSASSSLRPMNDAHREAAPHSAYIGEEPVSVVTLDDAVRDRSFARAFVKIDTQGFEREVLEGAEETLSRTVGLLIEMSMVELYEGQALWADLIEWLGARGFRLHALNQGFIDPVNFQTLQMDGVFVRAKVD